MLRRARLLSSPHVRVRASVPAFGSRQLRPPGLRPRWGDAGMRWKGMGSLTDGACHCIECLFWFCSAPAPLPNVGSQVHGPYNLFILRVASQSVLGFL
jgi:predicted dehydrogenase